MTIAMPDGYQLVDEAIDSYGEQLLRLSHRIHDLAELGFEEHRSVESIVELLRAEGFEPTVGCHGLETAFEVVAGSGHPRVAILAEYDALPEVGHGCGHNVICASAIGAFLGAAAAVGTTGGSVVLLGTPAEENGGGKEILAQNGALEGVDAAVMLHPMAAEHDVSHFESLGCRSVQVRYTGVPAHASAAPHQGRNALDAVVAAYQGIAALRQHIRPDERIHGIITEGGSAVNVVPEHAGALFLIRAAHVDTLMDLCERVESVFDGAATITGTRAEVTWNIGPTYLPMRSNPTLDQSFARHVRARGRVLAQDVDAPSQLGGSTDMGNVSLRVPSIHPSLAIAPPDVPMHSEHFAARAVSEAGDTAVLDGAVGLARSVVDFLADKDLRAAVLDDFATAGGAVDVTALIGPVRTTPLPDPAQH